MNSSSNPESTSLSLLESVIRHGPGAWERFCAVYGPMVYRWCRNKGLQPCDVENVVQQVFITLIRNLVRFRKERPTDGFRRWLWTVTHHKLVDYSRSQSRQLAGTGGGSHLHWLQQLAEPSELTNDDGIGEGSECNLGDVVRGALSLVRTRTASTTWDAFWLTTIENRKAEEVAHELGLSVESVYQAKSRILSRIRKEIDRIQSQP